MSRIFRSSTARRLDELEKRFAESLAQINAAFDDHLLSINENTNEIQSSYENLLGTDQKMEKLAERIDEVSLLLNMGTRFKKQEYAVQSLTQNEKELSLLLYYLTEKGPVHIQDIMKRTGLDAQGVLNYIQNLQKKGVPVKRNFYGSAIYLSLEEAFRRLQAKENVLEINEVMGRALG
ncbi:MAG: winged helix-turn-helix transcriptional regulator [DPANN group archaeon]|nr:winged helix-turn-helix transcriptional regulator [DPANN group archaeon]